MTAVTNCTCFQLHLASRQLSSKYKPLLAKLDVTFTQFLVLGLLWEKDGQSIKEIGLTLHLDSGTLTPLIKRLEGKKLLIRERSTQDERINHIRLTEQGHQMSIQGREIADAFYQSLSMTETERLQLNALLSKLIEA